MFSQWNRDRPIHQCCRNRQKNLLLIRRYHDLHRAFLTSPYRFGRRSWNVIERRIGGTALEEAPKSPAYERAYKCLNSKEKHLEMSGWGSTHHKVQVYMILIWVPPLMGTSAAPHAITNIRWGLPYGRWIGRNALSEKRPKRSEMRASWIIDWYGVE